jgi:hypothetical protein
MLKLLSVIALSACTATLTQPVYGEGFTPKPDRSLPAPNFATYDCFPFFPDSNGYSQTISAVQIYLEQSHGSGLAYWGSIRSRDDMLSRLNDGRTLRDSPAGWLSPGVAGRSELGKVRAEISAMSAALQWNITLYTHCKMLNESRLSPGKSHEYFEWLEERYDNTISTITNQTACSAAAPLSGSVVRMWLAWNLYRNRLYEDAKWSTERVEKDSRSDAEKLEMTLGDVPIPKKFDPNYQVEKCEVLSHGPLNDAAAALWVRAMSYYCTGQDSLTESAFADLTRKYAKGLIYDRLHDWFWRPADHTDPRLESCPWP